MSKTNTEVMEALQRLKFISDPKQHYIEWKSLIDKITQALHKAQAQEKELADKQENIEVLMEENHRLKEEIEYLRTKKVKVLEQELADKKELLDHMAKDHIALAKELAEIKGKQIYSYDVLQCFTDVSRGQIFECENVKIFYNNEYETFALNDERNIISLDLAYMLVNELKALCEVKENE